MVEERNVWSPAESARMALNVVLYPFQAESPNEHFVLGGIGSLMACLTKAAKEGRRLDILMDELQHAQVQSELTPMVIHLPPSVSAPAAVYMQETFARNADHEPRCSPELQHPFGTSNFGRLYTTPARQHVDQLCPLKFLHSSTDLTLNPASHPPLTDSSTRPGGATVHFLTWPALVVEQLVLGAHTRDSLHAAAFCVRLALTAGHGLAQAAAARAGARAGAPRDPNAAIVRSLEDALARMVPDATQRAALALAWHVRLDDSARAFPREMEAWERREVGRGVDAQPVGDVEAQYAWVQRVLQTVLRAEMRSHAPPQAHSLGRFAPTTREANERARVFA